MKLGVLGAGQLGLMLARAGRRIGVDFRFLSPDAHSPAGRVAEIIVADYENETALAHFVEGLDAVTYEFENIPLASIDRVLQSTMVLPPRAALAVAQDRLNEKETFARLAIPTARSCPVASLTELRRACDIVPLPAVLKTRRFGYDGKGQAVIGTSSDIEHAWVAVRGAPSLLEAQVCFTRELSLVCVRGRDGGTRFYPLVENHHSEGILRYSLAPAPRVSPELQELAQSYGNALLEFLQYAGVLTIEFFDVEGKLLANEIAPRVHNSAHWTMEGADVSQFENHVRAVCGMAPGSTEMQGAAGMVNVIGNEPDLSRVRDIPRVHVHMYGKSPAPRRKLGHITVLGSDMAEVTDGIRRVRLALTR